MRIEELIPTEVKQQLNYNNQPKHKRRRKRKRKKNNHNRKHQEHYSEHEIKRLMGQYDPVFKRGKGGAWRSK